MTDQPKQEFIAAKMNLVWFAALLSGDHGAFRPS